MDSRCHKNIRMGRTFRYRKMRNLISEEEKKENLILDVSLKKFLHEKGLKRDTTVPLLYLHNFSSTGRGLKAKKFIKKNSIIMRIPLNAIITCQKVTEDKDLGFLIANVPEKLKLVEVFTLFLLFHKNKLISEWNVYLSSLPTSYSVLFFCKDSEVKILPKFLKKIIEDYKLKLENCFKSLSRVWSELFINNKVSSPLTMTDIKWAWFTVNTRCVYMKGQPFSFLSDDNDSILVPYLDMLNHSFHASVLSKFNENNQCYEITTLESYKEHKQVFINYGPHDNIKLLCDYGFGLAGNPHDSIEITIAEILCNLANGNLPSERKVSLERKKSIICKYFNSKLSIGWEGHSWNLEAAVTLILMTDNELNDWKLIYRDMSLINSHSYALLFMYLIAKQKLHEFKEALLVVNDIKNPTDSLSLVKLLLEEFCAIIKIYLVDSD